MNLTRIRRLVQLIGLLQAGKGRKASSLATTCGVSRRTVFRDLDLLREAGVPLHYDDEHGEYRIPGTYFLPPTNFTAEEALAVMILCYELGGASPIPFCRAAQSAALKLEGSLPGSLRDRLREATAAVTIQLPPSNPLTDHQDVYERLLAAIAEKRSLRIRYESFSDDQILETKLSPYRLLFSRHSWYVIGRSSLHRELRTFNVGRITRLIPTLDHFVIPHRFSLDRYLGNAWHLIPEPGPDQEVLIRFQKLVARNVAEVVWHKTQRLTTRPDGTLDFAVTVSGLREISWWILGYGDQAEVLEPAALRELVATRVVTMGQIYGEYGGARTDMREPPDSAGG